MRAPIRHRRRSLAGIALAWLVAAAAGTIVAPMAAAAPTDYFANCDVNLRGAPATSAAVLAMIPTGTLVFAPQVVTGDPWSASCAGSVAGDTWFAITSVGGKAVSDLYGVGVVYAASGLFRAASWLEGIDVSRWQGTIDYAKVAAAGKRFVIAKATEGIGYTDPNWIKNRTNAAAAGLPIAGYHFARPDSNPTKPVEEADWFVSQLGLTNGMLVPVLDIERSGGMSTTNLQAWVGAWLTEVYAKTGVRPMIYTSPSFWRTYLGNTTTFANQGYTVLWVAHWFVGSPSVPASNWGGRGWTFWQYDDCGSVPGIGGCVDVDRFNGLDLTRVTVGADFSLTASPVEQSVEQGAVTSFTIPIDRQFFTLPIDLAVTGLPAGVDATLGPTPDSGSSATLTISASSGGTVPAAGTYPLTVTGTANGMTRSANATLVVTDAAPPTVSAPMPRLYARSTLWSAWSPVRTSWSGTDPSGITGYALEQQVNGGAWSAVSLPNATTTSIDQTPAIGSTYAYRVAASDGAGNTSDWATGPTVKPLLTQQGSTSVTYGGTWHTASVSSYSGGSDKYATASGAWAKFTFTGASVAWVSPTGPTRGDAYVYVDGVYKGTVHLYASAYQARQIVFAYNWAGNGSHTIKIVCRATSGNPRVDIDAFVRLSQT
jgi:Lyzozyme M1 (1,4-beta-N-acetylmuramidase)